MSILKLLASENYITVNKTLIKELGLEGAVLFGTLCSEYDLWSKQGKLKDGKFFCSLEKIEELTTLSPYKQRKLLSELQEKGLLTVTLEGLPAMRYFELNEEQVINLFNVRSKKISHQQDKQFNISNNINSKNNNSNKYFNNNKLLLKEHSSENFELKSSSQKSKQSRYSKIISLINDFTDNTELRDVLIKYFNLLIEMKVNLYTNQFKGLLNKLKSLADDEPTMQKIVENSIEHGWKSFYAPNNGYSQNNNGFVDNMKPVQFKHDKPMDLSDETF